jgi:hypothetical protein
MWQRRFVYGRSMTVNPNASQPIVFNNQQYPALTNPPPAPTSTSVSIVVQENTANSRFNIFESYLHVVYKIMKKIVVWLSADLKYAENPVKGWIGSAIRTVIFWVALTNILISNNQGIRLWSISIVAIMTGYWIRELSRR